MTGSVLLIHISAAQSRALTATLAREGAHAYRPVKADAENLLAAFAAGLSSFDKVYLCLEDATLSTYLRTKISHAEVFAWQSEIAAVRTLFADKGVQHIALATGVYPLLDHELTQKLFRIHTEYRADISYAENLPAGMCVDWVSRDLLESLDIMEAHDEDIIPGIRPFVEKNINQFHAEVHYEEPDLRLLRLDFSLASERSITKAAALIKQLKTNAPLYAQLQPLLDAAPGLLHTFPSYIELEFNATTGAVSYFSPLGYIEQQPAQLSAQHLDTVREFIAQGLGDTSVCASGLGEPLEHPQALNYLQSLLDDTNIRFVFIETNGILLEKLLPLAAHKHASKLRVIVLLNSLERYAEYSGAPASSLTVVKTAMKSFAMELAGKGKNPAEILYLQTLKVEENEAEIDALYALAEELGAAFLLQKYNRYAGLMPERRVSDMTPLERYSCWHLRRDLFIRANGDVAFCKQTIDPKKPAARGNLTKDSLSDLWKTQGGDFVANYKSQYPAHLPCASCDEYFTFNF